MKNKIGCFLKNRGGFLLLSFLIPLVVMITVYALNGIYLGSDRMILASDGYSQYANFHASFNSMLRGEQSIFYTWYGSLGLNYWSFSAYYLNGLFTPLVLLFDNHSMADALYVITLIKFACIGLSFWVFAVNTFKKMGPWYQLSFSIAYALMSYAVAYSEVIMWLDTFVYLPLVILGIHRVMDKRKPTLLFISYLALFLSNFYMAFMVGLFSFLYFWVRLLTDRERYKGSIFSYLITSLLAGGASMLTILPTIFDLTNNGEGLDPLNSFWTRDTGGWDFIVKNLVAVYDTSKYGSAPFIYIGLVPLLFAIYYFSTKKIPRRNKILYGSLLLFLIASVYIDPLNLLWHGLHAPNMFLFRFSFLFSFVIILLGGYGFEHFEKEDINQLVNIVLAVGAVAITAIVLSNKKRYDYITDFSLYLTIGFLALALLLLLLKGKQGVFQKWVPVLFLVMMVSEASLNANAMIQGIGAEWGYPSESAFDYDERSESIQTLVDKTKAENDGFYRLENLDRITLNDSFRFGYSGISMFSSIRNRHSSAYLNNLGYRSLGSNLNIKYENNTLLMDSLLGVKYNLSKSDIMKFGYEKIGEEGDYSLYENQYALPLGILTDDEIFETDAVKSQVGLFNYLSEEEEEMTKVVEPRKVEMKNVIETQSGNEVTYTGAGLTEPKEITWEVYVPAKQQAYLSMYPSSFSYLEDCTVEWTVNDVTRSSPLSSTGQYYNLGYYEEGTAVVVKVSFTGTRLVNLFQPDVLLIDTQKFEQAVEKINEKGIDLDVSDRRAMVEVELEKDQVLFTTIPYDAGWKAYVDGKEVGMPNLNKAFLTLNIPKGSHRIEFVFLPQGFKLGAIMFAGCLAMFIGYSGWLYSKRRKAYDE
ncbi:YfhO family protein [Enterococcus sp. BWM-S5]|uniref:YfhO family protein n=1 Tax=Enterococcus larvae TaxID=2794352 RepID=A0ABS4CJ81_9ENTE|nr:YfhO family protein [Enterococcus larvae]MBP1046498.1 YfhO family protein [Enterococcus larvae]